VDDGSASFFYEPAAVADKAVFLALRDGCETASVEPEEEEEGEKVRHGDGGAGQADNMKKAVNGKKSH